ncbi:sensor histidine kinase [Hymenobacter defluvii]|uniref:Histidine kinase n=1 Tax=Hymenobacter defluvii TaxID=2054411 RepID=A0ABS3T727_9BACT|nr:histidine kinase [Hymenobacter defluvii]MBO3269452.1 histidine kinase [Hymenobacter defluvii]
MSSLSVDSPTPAPTPTHRRWYWSLQVAGWLLYACLGLILIRLFAARVVIGWHLLAIQLAMAVVLLLVSHCVRAWMKRQHWKQLPFGALLWRLLVANGVAAVLGQIVLGVIIAFLIRPPASMGGLAGGAQFVGYILNTYFVLWLWTACYFGWHYLSRYKQAEVDKWKLQAAVREAEMSTLKAQINPHFLFNGLNNIRALVMEDPARARAMMTHLSDLLRYSIQLNGTEQVPLARELEIVEHYLQLEAMQLEERLTYTLDIDPVTLAVPIPPMTLQLLVENAIKHGIAPRPEGGVITISAQLAADGAQLHVVVRNTGSYQLPAPGHTGIGLRNARERLALLFGPAATLTLTNDPNAPNQVLAHVQLPVAAALPSHSTPATVASV